MFHKWGFLLGEIWGLLLLAALVGLLAGWIIWGRRKPAVVDTSAADRLRADLAACNSKTTDLSARLTAADQARVTAEQARDEADRARSAADARAASAEASATVSAAAASAAAPAPLAAMAAPASKPAPTATTTPAAQAKPQGLQAARAGKADDLKLISGIGPAMEKLCNKLGFFHFDQIAAWSAAEIAWVDENLEGFKGRVTRDDWVSQARDLAAGKPARPKSAK